jgi:hypothetical protein
MSVFLGEHRGLCLHRSGDGFLYDSGYHRPAGIHYFLYQAPHGIH